MNPIMASSQDMSISEQDDFEKLKFHEHKINGLKASRDPFKFPMPLGEVGTGGPGSIDSNLQGSNQPNHDAASSTDGGLKQSTFKATLVADKKIIKNTAGNVSKVSPYTISTGSNPTSKNISVSDLNKNGNLLESENNSASKIYRLHSNGKVIPIKYQVTGPANELLNISMKNNNNATLLIQLSAGSAGTLRIELDRNMIDSKKQDRHTDSSFAVFEDGIFTPFYETKNNNDLRQLMIGFHKGTSQISIFGTHVSPEYVNTATILYGICMTVIIIAILVSKYNYFNFTTFGRS